MNLSYRIGYVFFRNLMSYKRFVVPTFIASLVQPLFYLITFGIGMGAYVGLFGGKPYLNFLVPGVLISAVSALGFLRMPLRHVRQDDPREALRLPDRDPRLGRGRRRRRHRLGGLPGHGQRDADDGRRHVHGRLPGLRAQPCS